MSTGKYHKVLSCNKCRGLNKLVGDRYEDGGYVCETGTICTECGHADRWAYGHFESSEYMESNCETYGD